MSRQQIEAYMTVHDIGTEKQRLALNSKILSEILHSRGEVRVVAYNAIHKPIEDLPKYIGHHMTVDLIIKHRMGHAPR